MAAKSFKMGEICVKFSDKFVSFTEIKEVTEEDMKNRFDLLDLSGSYYRDETNLGWMVNDFMPPEMLVELRKCRTISNCEGWEEKYLSSMIVSSPAARGTVKLGPNVEFFEPNGSGKGLYLRAACDIDKGSDLLTAYGADYWIGETSLDTRIDPWARMAFVGWAMKKLVFPTLGTVRKIPAVLFPCIDHEGDPTMTHLSTPGVGTEAALASTETHEDRNALCSLWMRTVGLPHDGKNGLIEWFKACLTVGTRDIILPPPTPED